MLIFANRILQNSGVLLDGSLEYPIPRESILRSFYFSRLKIWLAVACRGAANWYKWIVLKKANLLKSRDAKLPVYRCYLRRRGCQTRDIDVSPVFLALSLGSSCLKYLRSETVQHCCNVPAHAGCNSASKHNVCSVGDERFVR